MRVGHASDNSLADGFIGVSVIGGIYAGSVDMPTGSVGLRGVSDYTANITDLDYTKEICRYTHSIYNRSEFIKRYRCKRFNGGRCNVFIRMCCYGYMDTYCINLVKIKSIVVQWYLVI